MCEQNSVPEREAHINLCNEPEDILRSGRPPDQIRERMSPIRIGNGDDFNIGAVSTKDLVINLSEKNIVRYMGNGNILVKDFVINVSGHNIVLHIGNGDVLANDFIANLAGNNVELYVGKGNPTKSKQRSSDDLSIGDVMAKCFIMNVEANNAVLHTGNGHVLASKFVVNVAASNIILHLGTGAVSADNFLANVCAKNFVADIWSQDFRGNVSAKHCNMVIHTGNEDGLENSPRRMLRGPESPTKGGKRCRDLFFTGDVHTGRDFVINSTMAVSCGDTLPTSQSPRLTYENRNDSPTNSPRPRNIPDSDSSPKSENSALVDPSETENATNNSLALIS